MRRACTYPIPRDALPRRLDQGRVIGKAEIIIAAKRNIFLTIYSHINALRAFQYTAVAQQALLSEQLQIVFKMSEGQRRVRRVMRAVCFTPTGACQAWLASPYPFAHRGCQW